MDIWLFWKTPNDGLMDDGFSLSFCYISHIWKLLPKLGSKLLNRLLSKSKMQLLNNFCSKLLQNCSAPWGLHMLL